MCLQSYDLEFTVAVTESILNEGCQNTQTVTKETDVKISKQSITEAQPL